MRVSFRCPWPPRELSPNARVHFMALSRVKKRYRADCGMLALLYGQKVRGADGFNVTLTFHPPDRRHRDDDNLEASFKSGRDGIAEALGVDDRKWTVTRAPLGEPVPGGCVMVEIEVIT